MFKIYWGESFNYYSMIFVGKVKNEDEAIDVISKNLEEKNFKTFYYRFLKHDDYTKIDYGSHTYFYFIVEDK